MRTMVYLLPGIAVMALVFWAYTENYETQRALNEVERLQERIGAERETLAILRAEWAYLNRPERLRDLAELNFDRLRLLPLMPEHFARVGQIDFPGSLSDPFGPPVPASSDGARP